jgi:hypothetical protein
LEGARELFLEGLTRAERDQFYERVSSEMTPSIRQRMIQVAEVTLLDRLAPGKVGRLHPRTLAALDQKIRLVLDL